MARALDHCPVIREARRKDMSMVTVGIDPHKHVHVAVAIDANGRPAGQPLTAKNGPPPDHSIADLGSPDQ
jgi:hypothetical protein